MYPSGQLRPDSAARNFFGRSEVETGHDSGTRDPDFDMSRFERVRAERRAGAEVRAPMCTLTSGFAQQRTLKQA